MTSSEPDIESKKELPVSHILKAGLFLNPYSQNGAFDFACSMPALIGGSLKRYRLYPFGL